NTHTFTFTWDAPATDIGDITFYVAGLAANGDDHESDDRVYSTSQVVTASSVGLNEVISNGFEKNLFPNPASDVINFMPSEFAITPDEVRIVTVTGTTAAIVKNNEFKVANNRVAIPLNTLASGTYTLYFVTKGRTTGYSKFQHTAVH
ncbi:MAG: T9SS type A sorting domain-containing protein, partial [Flavobacteriales bacterium]